VIQHRKLLDGQSQRNQGVKNNSDIKIQVKRDMSLTPVPIFIRNRGAFTLLELMMVLLIMSLLIGMAIPSMRSLKKERDLYSAAEIASSACTYARSVAVTTGKRTRLGMDRENSRIELLVENNPLDEPGAFTSQKWPTGLTGDLPKGVRIEQVYYPVIRDEGEEEEDSQKKSTQKEVDYQSEEEALEEREAVLIFEPDGSTRDTFIYLSVGDASATNVSSSTNEATASSSASSGETGSRANTFSVAIIGAIGTTVIVPRYTEEIFEVYDVPKVKEEVATTDVEKL
jgi:prepilin-type N-terminal cleavage/methylation domain-containing protein